MRSSSRPSRTYGSRAAILTLVCLTTSLALAQSAADLPHRHDALVGITTAGQPSAAGLSALAAAGYKSVIDLRAANEDRGLDEKKTVEELGMRYTNLPVSGADDITFKNADELDKLLAAAPKPVLLHCSTSNRVGALLALRAQRKGAERDKALDLGVASGLGSLKAVVEKKLGAGHD